MRVFKKHELDNFETIVKMTQPVLMAYLSEQLKKYYDERDIVVTKDYILAHGTIPVALVAHMDTVFKTAPTEVFYDTRKNVLWSPDGLGADDRAGVFAILQILQAGYRPNIVFSTDEEKGCIGARALADEKECPFEDLRYVIQLDRRGTVDCVFYDCDNPEFTKYVESFGFIETYGSFTDISELCPAWKVAGVNLSVGYRDEHSTSEVLFASPLFATIEKVKKMLSVPVEDIPHFKFIPCSYYGYPYAYGHNKSMYGYYGDYPGWDDDYDDGFGYLDKWGKLYGKKGIGNSKCVCAFCGKEFNEDEVFPIIMKDGSDGWCCVDCCDAHVNWCECCQEGFEVDENNYYKTLCPDCEKDMEEGRIYGTY